MSPPPCGGTITQAPPNGESAFLLMRSCIVSKGSALDIPVLIIWLYIAVHHLAHAGRICKGNRHFLGYTRVGRPAAIAPRHDEFLRVGIVGDHGHHRRVDVLFPTRHVRSPLSREGSEAGCRPGPRSFRRQRQETGSSTASA